LPRPSLGTVLLLPLIVIGSAFVAPVAFAVKNPHGVQLLPIRSATRKLPEAPATIPVVAPPGSAIHQVRRGDSLPSVARQYLVKTRYLTSTELAEAIRQANGGRQGNLLKPGENLIIPGILESPIVEKNVPIAKDFEVRAIYLTGVMAGSDHGLGIIRHWRDVGGNAVVFDVKDSDGIVNIVFDHPLAAGQKHYIHDLPKFVRFLHSQNMHAIARIAIFRDEHLVTTHPELAVKSRSTGQPWRENGKLVWTDPSNPKVQDYNIALAKFVAQSGVDEVQFDYVRFPAEGDQKDAGFAFQTEHPKWQRTDVIADFLKRTYAEIHPTGALFSLDVFGVMAWQRHIDLSHTGQDIVAMAKHCDVLSPMIYPSHFFGMDGIARPGDAPEHFIGESMDRFMLITRGRSSIGEKADANGKGGSETKAKPAASLKEAKLNTADVEKNSAEMAGPEKVNNTANQANYVVIRPWLQAFAWRTKTYSPKYIEVQVDVAKQRGGIGFLFWNANNDYSKPFIAMPEMRLAKGKFFRGDELPAAGKSEPVAVAAPVASAAAPEAHAESGAVDTSYHVPKIWRH